MVLRGFFDTLAKHGVVPIAAVGQRFDPEKHEAMAQIESGTYEPDTVVEEYHKGYLLRDRLLRPALVSVAKTPKSQGKKTPVARLKTNLAMIKFHQIIRNLTEF